MYLIYFYRTANVFELLNQPVLRRGWLKSGIAPLEFAMEVLKKVDVFAPNTLHSWYNLNKTHKPEYFFQLMNSISGGWN